MAGIVVVGGMIFAKLEAEWGLSWVIYCGVPVALTLLLPPLAFQMRAAEVVEYLLMAWCTSPLIHLVFSFFFGWKEYMPFLRVPAIWELGRVVSGGVEPSFQGDCPDVLRIDQVPPHGSGLRMRKVSQDQV